MAHEGCEFGVVLEGTLAVTVGGRSYTLQPGDLISYDSHRPHRFVNNGAAPVRTLWVNLKAERLQ
jgi:quercetin dioxygenase-like cupin family protein